MSKKRTAVQPRPGQRPPAGRRPPVRRSGLPGWVLPVTMTVVALVIIFVAAILYYRATPSPSPAGSITAATGQTVDGIPCQEEMLQYHVHAHLAIFASGQPRTVPAQVGIPGTCLYYLHTHDDTGIVHVEAPTQRSFTLGQFFDIWGQPLSATQVGGDRGTVTAYVN